MLVWDNKLSEAVYNIINGYLRQGNPLTGEHIKKEQDMKCFIGCKIIKAEPMDEYAFLRKFKDINAEVSKSRLGYHVVYSNPDGSEYHSWSPKDVFEIAYRPITAGEIKFMDDFISLRPTKQRRI